MGTTTTDTKFIRLKPSALLLPMNFPEREQEPPLSLLKEEIIQYGGVLWPLAVRVDGKSEFRVIDGRRRLRAVWELQDEGYEKIVRWIPGMVVESRGPVDDLKLFLLLNNHTPIGVGQYEAALAAIEAASAGGAV